MEAARLCDPSRDISTNEKLAEYWLEVQQLIACVRTQSENPSSKKASS